MSRQRRELNTHGFSGAAIFGKIAALPRAGMPPSPLPAAQAPLRRSFVCPPRRRAPAPSPPRHAARRRQRHARRRAGAGRPGRAGPGARPPGRPPRRVPGRAAPGRGARAAVFPPELPGKCKLGAPGAPGRGASVPMWWRAETGGSRACCGWHSNKSRDDALRRVQRPLVGNEAPDFTADAVFDQEFQTVSLSQYRVRARPDAALQRLVACPYVSTADRD